jgi:hypothetical protein
MEASAWSMVAGLLPSPFRWDRYSVRVSPVAGRARRSALVHQALNRASRWHSRGGDALLDRGAGLR